MRTTFEDLSVELFYEIFIYFQPHEIFNVFSDLNSRITAIIKNFSPKSIYLGFNGMNIEVTSFYYKYLSQTNICTCLISLCVSDTLSIGNGLWFAKHGYTLINLRHLSLIDIIRSSFEIILDSLSPIDSLIMLTVRFSTLTRAVSTYIGVPEGAYHERIFRLFPSIRVCHLYFRRYLFQTIDSSFVLPVHKTFMPIETSLLNLQSLALRHCSPGFLSHLFEHLPQLEHVRCQLHNDASWLPKQHSLRHNYNNRYTPINKCLAPNLRRLEIDWVEKVVSMKAIEMLLEYEVLFQLTNFTFSFRITDFDVLRNILSRLSSQCVYRFDVTWHVGVASLSDRSKVLSNTFEQLKGSIPIELKLSLEENNYFMQARTLPTMDSCLCVYSDVDRNTTYGQSRWPYNKHTLNSRWLRCNEIRMSEFDDPMNDEFLSLWSNIICWDRIKSVNLFQPLDRTHMHVLLSQAINLRILTLYYEYYRHDPISLKEECSIELINDKSLCDKLTSNGLQQLNLTISGSESSLISIAHLIVERLPHLQVIELTCYEDEALEIVKIFIYGLVKLNFVTLCGFMGCGPFYAKKIRAICDSDTRPFRTEVAKNLDTDTIFIWL